jgi:hypothetical protein
MRRRLTAAPIIGLVLLTLAGCTTTPTSSTGPTSSPASHTVSPLSASLAATMKNVAGISNPVAFVQGLNQLKTAVADGNKAKVAAFGAYPLNVYAGGKKETIANARAFVQKYNRIMTSRVKAAILDQRVNQLFVNDQGVMVGSGQVWLSQSGSRACIIISINK